jgi:hypothetical protein
MKEKTNEQGGPFIFISYSHKITDKAEEVIRALQTNGYRVWFDTGLTPGSSYNDVIAEHIEACEVFCCLLSEEYYQSQYCRQEFVFAKEELKKPIIPVYVGKLEAIKATLPAGTRMWLAGVHALELNRIEDFIGGIERSGAAAKCRSISASAGDVMLTESPRFKMDAGTNKPSGAYICYRRSDAAFFARMLYEKLRERNMDAFIDLESIRTGSISSKIINTIEQCQNFILLISKDTFPRCSQKDDWVRQEIEYALKTKKNIITVIIGGASFSYSSLPESIREIVDYNMIVADMHEDPDLLFGRIINLLA